MASGASDARAVNAQIGSIVDGTPTKRFIPVGIEFNRGKWASGRKPETK